MRCNNCGWDNDPGVAACVKCGHTLASFENRERGVAQPVADYGNGSPRPTVIGVGLGDQQQAPRPTVMGAAGYADQQPRPTVVMGRNALQNEPSAAAQTGKKQCSRCGYPLLDSFSNCPSCGAPVNNYPDNQPSRDELEIDENTTCDHCGTEVPISFRFCPSCGSPIKLKTVRAIRHKAQPAPEPVKPKCTLTIVLEDDEQGEGAKNCFEGDSVILTRENTERDNRTITSKEQAELLCEDGKWFVVNRSELGSTYLEANRKLELQPGDIIVLGDRRFRFDIEQ
jgi:hypothetical protein